jgi:3-hydroxybutyryl-CoA dehydrogenase
VVGLGTMGAGIAQVCVQAGFETVGREISVELCERARATIDRYLSRGVEKERLTQEEKDAALARLTTTTEPADLAGCDLVIEAIVEEPEAKRALFSELSTIAPEAILATNTSALSVTEIAAAAARERVVGLHFFNPAPVLPLVEVIRTELTADDVYDEAYAFAAALGKEPIRCHDTPGFVVNRVLIPVLNDCVRVLDEARVTPEDLDRALRFGLNWPIGPCALIDLIGVDTRTASSRPTRSATTTWSSGRRPAPTRSPPTRAPTSRRVLTSTSPNSHTSSTRTRRNRPGGGAGRGRGDRGARGLAADPGGGSRALRAALTVEARLSSPIACTGACARRRVPSGTRRTLCAW